MSSYSDLRSLILNNIKSNGRQEITGSVLQEVLLQMVDKSSVMEEISYENLVNLREHSVLSPSRLYRITDYETTTSSPGTLSAGHRFDIVVIALSEDTLSEQAWAIHHTGDTYFQNSHLEAWRILYCLDNDTSRFSWAVPASEGGKGVIYRMIDEWNNDCPYDFKNIQFKHPTNSTGYPDYYYTFSNIGSSVISDHSLNGAYCYGNKMGRHVSNETQNLNQNVFIQTSGLSYCHSNSFGNYCHHNSFLGNCYSLIFGNDCYSNSFGDSCYSNKFGNACYSNSFGHQCNYNTFGNNCFSNIFGNNCRANSFGNTCKSNNFGGNCDYNIMGNSCHSNIFGGSCYSNSFGSSCSSNKFGQSCTYNRFGNACNSNSFGKGCYSNSFGNSCSSNTFGNYCVYNSLGNACSSNRFEGGGSPGNYFAGNSFGDDVRSISLWNDATASGSNRVKHYRVASGTQGQGGIMMIEVFRENSTETYIGRNSGGVIKQFCLADLV